MRRGKKKPKRKVKVQVRGGKKIKKQSNKIQEMASNLL